MFEIQASSGCVSQLQGWYDILTQHFLFKDHSFYNFYQLKFGSWIINIRFQKRWSSSKYLVGLFAWKLEILQNNFYKQIMKMLPNHVNVFWLIMQIMNMLPNQILPFFSSISKLWICSQIISTTFSFIKQMMKLLPNHFFNIFLY